METLNHHSSGSLVPKRGFLLLSTAILLQAELQDKIEDAERERVKLTAEYKREKVRK